jgi:serine/threonine protein kinase
MGVVQGTPLYKSPGVVNGITTRDAYWTARAKIHRLGVAHNDTHAGNIMIDNKGVARFVDLGLAQVSRKAALAEALGGASRTGADFEAEKQLYSRGKGKIFNLISSNIRTVVEAMKADGLSDSDVRRFRSTDIRQKDEYFNTNPSWSKITDKQAKKYIDLLYDGV